MRGAASVAKVEDGHSQVRAIFQELISDSVAQQARLLSGDGARVAFQGAAHSYSHAAALKYLAGRGLRGDLAGYRTFRDAAGALLAGDADLAVLPIENTTAELLARYLAGRLLDDLARHHGYRPAVLRVEVEENVGQSATCELRLS